jgi:transcriptional regulator with XRE-family HTH domain
MTTTQSPAWTLGDRLRKARRTAGLSVDVMAHELGVTDRTVQNYESDRTPPKRSALLAYAQLTGVPLWWLEGDDPPGDTVTLREHWCFRSSRAA